MTNWYTGNARRGFLRGTVVAAAVFLSWLCLAVAMPGSKGMSASRAAA